MLFSDREVQLQNGNWNQCRS